MILGYLLMSSHCIVLSNIHLWLYARSHYSLTMSVDVQISVLVHTSSHLCAPPPVYLYHYSISWYGCFLYNIDIIDINNTTLLVIRTIIHSRIDVNFDAVHGRVSLLVVCCIHQYFIEYLIQSRNIGEFSLFHHTWFLIHHPHQLHKQYITLCYCLVIIWFICYTCIGKQLK